MKKIGNTQSGTLLVEMTDAASNFKADITDAQAGQIYKGLLDIKHVLKLVEDNAEPGAAGVVRHHIQDVFKGVRGGCSLEIHREGRRSGGRVDRQRRPVFFRMRWP